MKRFLINLTCFLFSLFLLTIILDFIISQGLKKMDDYRFQSWDEIKQKHINADIIIMGNSRALSHFNPHIIDSVLSKHTYNLGIGGYAFNVQYLKYKYYRHYNSKPKIIIQNVDFVTLRNDQIENAHESEQFYPFTYDNYLRTNLSTIGLPKSYCYVPLYRYWGHQMLIKNGIFELFKIKHYHNKQSTNGYVPEIGHWNGSELSKLRTIDSSMDPQIIILFKKYLEECQKENIKVILVNSPIYKDAIPKINQAKDVNLLFKNMAKKYNCIYLDYTMNYDLCNDTNNFCVSVHLNETAANIFSKKLSNDLDSILNH